MTTSAGAPEPRRRSFLRLTAIVARRDYLRTVRRRGFIFGTALLPISIVGLFVVSVLFIPATGAPSGTWTLAVVNESGVELRTPAGAPVTPLGRDAAERALEAEELREFYVIPAGYPDRPQVQRVIGRASTPGLEDLQRRASQELLLARVLRLSLLAGTDLPEEVTARIVQPQIVEDVNLDGVPGQPRPELGLGLMLPYAFAFLFVISIFITSGYLLQSVTEEKENRVVEIVLSSVPPQPLMAGKILGLGAAGLTQVAIWVATGLIALALAGDRFPVLGAIQLDPVVVGLGLAYFVVGYLAYGAIFAAIGAMAPGTREAHQYSGFFGFFAVIPLIMASAFFSEPSSPLVTALALIPLTAPAAMLQLLAVAPEPPWALVAASLLSLVVFALLAALAASRIFRATLLLYGARPSLRRIFEAVAARG